MIKATGFLSALLIPAFLFAQLPDVEKYHKCELTFTGSVEYDNPLQAVKWMKITFLSPSEKEKTIYGFWDGGLTWKARFMPDEVGAWSFTTSCSDGENNGLHGRKGKFQCVRNRDTQPIYVNGPVIRPPGVYHLSHADGTPFFWLGCTAWNGALRSTEEEWNKYLKHRASHGYSAIQFATTQWRGCDKNSEGLVAFAGSDTISVYPEFFKRLDKKIDQVNEHGLVAAPVILWAFSGRGKELNPGFYLPDDQAILLARYIVARYGANHVVWFLGGDGNYTGEYEQRWKTIGRDVFGENRHQGVVAQHPMGRSWIGEIYKDEGWLDIIGYQSGHGNSESVTDGITKGHVANKWMRIPARPLINLEPVYEQIRPNFTDDVVRKACYRSLFSAPVSGVTYGANGIWPWLRKGEKILNHGDAPWTLPWEQSLDLPGSVQMGYLARFFQDLPWWNLYPAQELLVRQPGDQNAHQYVSVLKTLGNKMILVYFPARLSAEIRNTAGYNYSAKWFNPARNEYLPGSVSGGEPTISVTSPSDTDMVLILKADISSPLKIRRAPR